MNLDELSATFNLSEILDTTVGLFPDFVEIAKGGTFVGGVEFSPYEFYSDQEDRIFDHWKLQKDRMMKNFFEAIEIMSWAVYRVWSRELKLGIKNNEKGFSLDSLDKETIKQLFLDNIDCPEGKELRDLITQRA